MCTLTSLLPHDATHAHAQEEMNKLLDAFEAERAQQTQLQQQV